MRLKLENGMNYGIDQFGNRVCVGAKMGRGNTLPENRFAPVKLHMEKLRLVDGDYDNGGAYWGNTPGTDIYCAHGVWGIPFKPVRIFVRATDRNDAKELVRELLKNSRFYR